MKWSTEFYGSFFPVKDFNFQENDYVIGKKKCGGNAQYIRKDRWLHHTSFLWDYQQHRMQTLLHPKKTPMYRQGRSHDEFLCKLSDYISDKTLFLDALKQELSKRYEVIHTDLRQASTILDSSYRKATTYVEL